ncbi:MAG: hypothetical protein U0736_07470 [Gemmataceae bacterium]
MDDLTERLRSLPPDNRHDLVFENVQARMRTSLLMNTGFVVGTGDVSELALGWCTYNADHMSMYNPNTSIPKTLVKFLVDWAAQRVRGRGPRHLARHRRHPHLPGIAAHRPRGQGGAGDRGGVSGRMSCTTSSLSLPPLRLVAGKDPVPRGAGVKRAATPPTSTVTG